MTAIITMSKMLIVGLDSGVIDDKKVVKCAWYVRSVLAITIAGTHFLYLGSNDHILGKVLRRNEPKNQQARRITEAVMFDGQIAMRRERSI